MVDYVFLGLEEIKIAQELQCSNQLKGESYSVADISFSKSLPLESVRT